MARFSDLYTNPATGRVSHSKVWSNIAYVVATFVIILLAVRDKLTADMFLIYLGGTSGTNLLSKGISLKYTGGKGAPDASSGVGP